MKVRARLAIPSLALAALALACGPGPSKNQAKRVGKEATLDSDAPTSLSNVDFVESERDGDPLVVGCADGQREGFADLKKFPTIAGCLAVWDGEMNLRKGKTSKVCGDDLDVCSSPADVCAQGWHVCARNGDYNDLADRISGEQCSGEAGPGKFIAAISHVKKKGECPDPPGPTTRYPCLDEGFGAEPICCGEGCKQGKCKDAVWTGQSRISVGKAEGCSTVSSDRNGGILCCKDDDAPPPRPVPTDGTPTATETGGDTGATGGETGDGASPPTPTTVPAGTDPTGKSTTEKNAG